MEHTLESMEAISYSYDTYIKECKKSGKKEIGFFAYIIGALKGTL